MIETILTNLASTSPLGAVLAWALWQNTRHQKENVDIIKCNTKAMTALKMAIEVLSSISLQKEKLT